MKKTIEMFIIKSRPVLIDASKAIAAQDIKPVLTPQEKELLEKLAK
ncbi:hypothetical protein [Lysobacter sp. 1R34A]|jgi:hypothetical protein